MATNLILTKQSSDTEIRSYFKAILELSKSDNEYPVKLDEVWMLVYGKKSDSVKSLQKDFIENIDYQVLRQNPQNPKGGRPSENYYLAIPCLEFFIARKVRAVFEVYRQVFHHKVNTLENISRKDLAKMLYESELEKERLQEEVKRKDDEIQKERNRQIGQDSLSGRVAVLEQLVIPEFANLQGCEQPKANEAILVSRISPSVAKTRYPGALLMYEVRHRLLQQRGVNIYMRDLVRFLHREGWLVTNETVHNMPTADAINNGWMLPTGSNGRARKGKCVYIPRMSERGYVKFLEILSQKGGVK